MVIAMANSLYKMRLQGIMVAVFIVLDWLFVITEEYNYHDSLQARLIEGIGHEYHIQISECN